MKKRVLLLIFALLFAYSASSANDTLRAFEPASGAIAPPLPPEQVEEGKYILTLKLIDYETKELINDTHVNIGIRGAEETNMLQYVGKDGLLKLMLENGLYEITLKADELETL